MISQADEPATLQDLDVEKALLSSVFGRVAAFLAVQNVVRAEYFYSTGHQLIWQSLLRLTDRNEPTDVVTVANDMDAHGELDHAGGVQALQQLYHSVPHGYHADRYAEMVRDRWQERELRALCRETIEDSSPLETIAERVGRLESGCLSILEASVATGPVSASDAVMALAERWENKLAIGQPTGFVQLDKMLGGLRPGTVNVIAARPGMGKTALAICIARHFLMRGDPVQFCSLEMGRAEVIQRLLSLVSGFMFSRLDTSESLDDFERDQLTSAMSDVGSLPLLIDDSSEQSTQTISATMRLTRKRTGLSLGIVDYLQLVKPADTKVIREQQVAQMSRSLKILARDLQIPILLLAQLNREVENRDGGKPRLRDLRESGSIEQDADSVMFIYEPNADDPARRDVVVAKNRHGPTGQISLEWSGRVMRFRDLVQPEVDHGFA